MKYYFFFILRSPLILLCLLLSFFLLEKFYIDYLEKYRLSNFVDSFERILDGFEKRIDAEQEEQFLYEYSYMGDLVEKKKDLREIHSWLKDIVFFSPDKQQIGTYTLKQNPSFFLPFMNFVSPIKHFTIIISKGGIYLLSYVEDTITKEHLGYGVYYLLPDTSMEHIDQNYWFFADIDAKELFFISNVMTKRKKDKILKILSNSNLITSEDIIFESDFVLKGLSKFGLYIGFVSFHKWWHYKSIYFFIFIFLLFGFMQYLRHRVEKKKEMIYYYLERLKENRKLLS